MITNISILGSQASTVKTKRSKNEDIYQVASRRLSNDICDDRIQTAQEPTPCYTA